jgi:hypothetical protein
MRLSTVIGINPQDRKREERPRSSDGSQHRFLTPVQKGQTFRPPGCYIGERQRIQVAPLDVAATMSYEIRFQKAGLGLIPLLERANRNLLLQQRSRSRSRNAALTKFALRTQEAIRRRCAHGKQLASALPRNVEMLMPQKSLR